MKQLLLGSLLIVLTGSNIHGQLQTSPSAPSYDRSKFHQAIGFHNTSQNVFFEDYNGFLELAFDNSFTIEFWAKIPSSVQPGTMVLRTNNFDINFASGDDGNGNLTPSLLFLVKSYDSNGNQFPDEDFYYHLVGQNIPYFNEWFHVAIVRNRATSFPYHEFNSYPGTIRMYINGISPSYANAGPLADLLPLGEGGGMHMALGYSSYLKVDELRIWNTARSAPEVYTYMNKAIDRNTGGLVAYYSFDHNNPNGTQYQNLGNQNIPNESTGFGSPSTNGSELAGWVGGHPSQGPVPVSGTDRNYVSESDGSWNDPSTWGGEVPRENEIVTVDHSVTLDQNRTQGGLIFRGPQATARKAGSVSDEKLVYTNGHTLTLLSPPVNGDETGYIVTNGGNLIVENIPYTGAKLPVGTETAYRPVSVAQQGRYQFLSFSVEAKDEISPSVATGAAVVNASWDVSPLPSATGSYEIGFQWDGSDESDGFSQQDAKVANYHDNSWNVLESGEITNESSGSYGIKATVSQFSPFIITSDQSSLPVRLVRFEVTQEEETAVLKWSASDAENFDRFEIERSSDASDWITIGREVMPRQGRDIQHYTFFDPIPATSTQSIYYRIKMIDLDNSFAYSPIRILSTNFHSKFSVFPNPAEKNSEIKLKFTGDLTHADVKIVSLSGLEVHTQSGISNESVKLPELPTGIYILSVKDQSGQIYREKILIR